MCLGIEVEDQGGRGRQIMFDDPNAALPLLTKDGSTSWVSWGVRHPSELSFPEAIPITGWLRYAHITIGKINRWHPKPVLIVVRRFMIIADGAPLWIALGSGMAIQGALIRSPKEDIMRAYVVTEQPPAEYVQVHDHWPRVIRRKLGA